MGFCKIKIIISSLVFIILFQGLVYCQSNSTIITQQDSNQKPNDIQVYGEEKIPVNENEKVVNPLIKLEEKFSFWNSFLSGFSIIFVAEIGDRTFILIMLYSITNNYLKTFLISNFVLLLWNFISIMIGYEIPVLMNKDLVEWVGIFTFTIFGILMIKEGYYMESKFVEEEVLEEEENLKLTHAHHSHGVKVHANDSCEFKISGKNKVEYTSSQNDLKESLLNKRKNSDEIDLRKNNDVERNNKSEDDQGQNSFNSIWTFAFMLITAELGDKSQIAAIVIGATQNLYGVLLGTSLAHSLCTVIAIVFGNIFAKYVTTRQITLIGGIIFFIFAAVFLIGKL